MFLIQKIQTWLAGDDDLDDEIYAGIAELFVHLAPIVQELSGGHWDLIFDIIEMNLEVSFSSFSFTMSQPLTFDLAARARAGTTTPRCRQCTTRAVSWA